MPIPWRPAISLRHPVRLKTSDYKRTNHIILYGYDFRRRGRADASQQSIWTRSPALRRFRSRSSNTTQLLGGIGSVEIQARDDKLLLAFDALALSEMLGTQISLGKIIYGDNHSTLNVKTAVLELDVREHIAKIASLLASPSPPDLVLIPHCAECEFRSLCQQKAMDKDDLSLLSGMTAKERKTFMIKGSLLRPNCPIRSVLGDVPNGCATNGNCTTTRSEPWLFGKRKSISSAVQS